MNLREVLGRKAVVIEGHRFVVRRPSTEEGLAWMKGVPSIRPSADPQLPDPARVLEAIRNYLVEIDGEVYDAKENPPEEFPFAITIPLFNLIYSVAMPAEETAAAGRLLRE